MADDADAMKSIDNDLMKMFGQADAVVVPPTRRQLAYEALGRWHPLLGLEMDGTRAEATLVRLWPCQQLPPTLSSAEEDRAFLMTDLRPFLPSGGLDLFGDEFSGNWATKI